MREIRSRKTPNTARDTFYAVIYVTCTVQTQPQIFKQSSTVVPTECIDKRPRLHLFESYLKFRNIHDLEFIFVILRDLCYLCLSAYDCMLRIQNFSVSCWSTSSKIQSRETRFSAMLVLLLCIIVKTCSFTKYELLWKPISWILIIYPTSL